MTLITPEQLWYVTQVYPEHVTIEEATECFGKRVKTSSDISYWQAAAKVINDLVEKD